jgi:hypothetical protein
MSWDEAFANHYEQWSAQMTADVAFYVELARKADGPLVELAIGSGRVAGLATELADAASRDDLQGRRSARAKS